VILDVLRKRDEGIAVGQLIRTALTSLTHVAERGLVDHSVAVSFMCCRPTLARSRDLRWSDADAHLRVHDILQHLSLPIKCRDLQVILQDFLHVLPVRTNGENELVRLHLEATAKMSVGFTVMIAIECGGATGRTGEPERRDISLGARPLLGARSFRGCGDFVQEPSVTLNAVSVKSARCVASPLAGSSDEHLRPFVACTNCKSVSLRDEVVIDIAISATATPARSRIARCPRLAVGINHSPGAKFELTCYVILDVLRKRDEGIAVGQLIRTALTSLTHVAERGLVDHSIAVSIMRCRPTLARIDWLRPSTRRGLPYLNTLLEITIDQIVVQRGSRINLRSRTRYLTGRLANDNFDERHVGDVVTVANVQFGLIHGA